jgi:Domain of unknown function (DUF4347)/NPCBM/NEW2 domain/Glucose / Sorbosone dehydrogenase/Calx-beta domain
MLRNNFTGQTFESTFTQTELPGSQKLLTLLGNGFRDPQTIAFIDSNVSSAMDIMAGIQADIKIFLDPTRDGVTQITDELKQYRCLSSISIISHGNASEVQLGNDLLNDKSLSRYSNQLQQWKSALAQDADILFYGCGIAAGEFGQAFIDRISELTDADIAASTDTTGNSAKGGNWNLEYATGKIETSTPFTNSFISSYQGLLPTFYLSDLTATAATNGWGAIEKDKSNGELGATDGKTLTLNGLTYTKGLGVHAGSDITYALGGNYTRFISDIGIDDEVGGNGSVIFQVFADGVNIYDSGLMAGNTATKTVNVDVAGKQNLQLVVTDSGNGNGYDHADWANARLESGSPILDTTAPTATLNAIPLSVSPNSTTPYTFAVTYSDNVAVNSSTLDSTDLLVTGLNSYSQLATFVSATPSTNGSSLTATYRINPAAGAWDTNEAGTYTVALQTNQVRDTSNNAVIAATLGTFQVDVSTATTAYLSDLTATAAINGWGAIEKDKSNGELGATDGKTLTLNGLTYNKGLGVHAGSDATYALGGNYTRFISDIGIDDEVGGNGSVIFQVFADGASIYDSGLMTGNTATKTVNVDVAGKQNLRLIVTDSADGNGYDHADWANARLTSVPLGPDTNAPTSTLTATAINSSISAPYTFNVTYADATSVNVSTINGSTTSSDVQITGSNGYSQLAQLVSITPNTNSPTVAATYQITAPDGIWNWNDRGTYTATLLTGAVQDTLGNTTTTETTLGTFQNTVESIFLLATNSSQVAEGSAINITVRRQGDTSGAASIDYFTGGNSTATPNVNYTPIPISTLTFGPTETEKTITVQTLNDGVVNTNKTVSLLIQNPIGADLGPSRTSSITINDTAGPVLTYLSDLPFTSTNGWGPVERDRSNGERGAADGNTLKLGSTNYAKGIGTHSNSQINYNLGGNYDSFFAYVGVDDEVFSNGSVVFQILADGVLLYDSGLMNGLSSTKLANVNVAGKQNLTLIVNDGGNGNSSDHADWADAQLVVGNYIPPQPQSTNILREQVVTGLNQPTTFDWSPNGQLMFIAEKGGIVKTFVQASTSNALPIGLRPTPFIDISAQVNNVADRGLLGMAIDPFFGKNQNRDFVYLAFTYDPPEAEFNSGLAGRDGQGNRPARLIRVTADPTTNLTTAIAGSEVVLLGKNSLWQYTSNPEIDSTVNFTSLPSGIANGSTITPPNALIEDADPTNLGRDYSAADTNFNLNNNIRDYLAGDSDSHTIGQVQFAPDGSLYVTVGDGTSYNSVDWRSTRVQDVDSLSGKLLRINPLTGQGYADNPFSNGNLDSNRSKVWSLGIRNSFRFTFNPTTGIPYLGEVGWTAWEEINIATKGSNLGWPYFEGPNQNLGYSTLPQAQSFYNGGQAVGPLLSRNHNASLNLDGLAATALIMGDFYTGTSLPSIYNGALFYNDVGLGTVYATIFNLDGTVKSTEIFDNLPYIVRMKTGSDGYLYYASLYGNVIGRWKLG